MFNRLIHGGIVALLVTDIWIVVYTNTLTFLTFFFPPVVEEQFLRDIAFPKPFDIPLYLGLTMLMIVALWLSKRLARHMGFGSLDFIKKFPMVGKICFFVVLLLIFISHLGSYPLAFVAEPFTLRSDKGLYWLIPGLYLSAILFVIVESAIIWMMTNKNKRGALIFFLSILIVIVIFTFEPHFPISPHDYAFFFGPILEIAQGKTIFTDIPVQHGMLPILLLSILYKVGIFKLATLPILIWLLYVAQYFLMFYIFLRISRSIGFALIGLFSIITINYYSLYHLAISVPQIGPMRWLPGVIIVLLLMKNRIDSRKIVFAVSLFTFWILDAGIALILSYVATLAVLFLNRVISFKRAVIATCSIAALIGMLALLLTVAHIISGYALIDWPSVFIRLREYAGQGIAQMPMVEKSFLWIVILTYVASIVYFLGNRNQSLLLFSANLSLFSSIYYVGRSHPHNLFHISALALLNLFILLSLIVTHITSRRIKIGFLLIFFTLTIVLPALARSYTLTEIIISRYERLRVGNPLTSEVEEKLIPYYSKEAQLIRDNIPEKEALVLSTDDTYLLYLSKKTSMLGENPQVAILSQMALQKATQKPSRICPNTIAVDCTIFNRCPPFAYFGEPAFTTDRILAEIEKQCKINYIPKTCTSKVCIAEKQERTH